MAAPSLANMTPASAQSGGTDFTLTVNGQNFVNGAQVFWGATPLTTAFVNSGQLTATVTAGLIATAGTVNVSVLSSGLVSNALIFAIPSPPNAIDLATLAEVKGWIYTQQGTPADDFVLQLLITAASQYFLSETRRASLNSVADYTEQYNGNGQVQLALRQFPIVSVSSLLINGYAVPESSGYPNPGWAIDNTRQLIVLANGGAGAGWYPGYGVPYRFVRGVLNVQVSYSAGYNGAPYDLNEACIQLVGQNYKRRGWIDQASVALAEGGGTQTFRNWDVSPQVRRTIENYKRRWGANGA